VHEAASSWPQQLHPQPPSGGFFAFEWQCDGVGTMPPEARAFGFCLSDKGFEKL
jgi:hypothetical protein